MTKIISTPGEKANVELSNVIHHLILKTDMLEHTCHSLSNTVANALVVLDAFREIMLNKKFVSEKTLKKIIKKYADEMHTNLKDFNELQNKIKLEDFDDHVGAHS